MHPLFLVTLKLFGVFGVVLNPNGPVHQNYSTSCIRAVIESQFVESNKLLTVLFTSNLSTKAFRIQENVIKNINEKSTWVLEIIDGKRHDFQSRELCLNCPVQQEGVKEIIKHNFQLDYKTTYCVMVVDSTEQFDKGLRSFLKLRTINYHAFFFVYFAEALPNHKDLAKQMLLSLWRKNIHNTAVLIPSYSLTTFAIYGLNVFSPSTTCGTRPLVKLMNVCKKGALLKNNSLFRSNLPRTFRNCSITTVAMKYPPFVISQKEGFEIYVLNELGKILDIKFDIEVEDAGDWGVRLSPNNWSGPLENVNKRSAIAIGNITPNPEYVLDFELSIAYFYEHLVWIVPAALPIPRWKNVFVIFTYELWLACFGFYVLGVGLLHALSHCADGLSLLVSIAVPKQPRTLGTRSVFMSMAMYSMILLVLYQTFLISHLLNPVYEKQIETVQDIFDSGMGIGGITSFKEFFNDSEDKRAMRIYEMFEIYEEVNDTAFNWLITVADDRDTCTLSSRFYTNYLMNLNRSVFVNKQGDEKIYILQELIFSYPLRMIQPRGFALRGLFDHVLWKLVNGGIIVHWAKKYRHHIHMDEGSEDDGTELTVRHLQGAFTVLFFGYAFATVTFVGELILNYCRKKRLKRRFIRLVNTKIIKKSK